MRRPQISIHRGATQVGDGPGRVRPGERIDLYVGNLSEGCHDTGTGGCSSKPDEPVRPATDVGVVLRQGNRSWQLGTVSGHGASRADTLHVSLPADLTAGEATIRVGDGRLRLQVTNR